MSGKVPELNLVFDEPVQRKKAPKHLADFAPADRKAFAKELGFQPFRASQIAIITSRIFRQTQKTGPIFPPLNVRRLQMH